MIRSFADKTTQAIYDGLVSKLARRLPVELHVKAKRLLDLIDGAGTIEDLKIPPGNRLEALKGNLVGFHSIRINDQWRIIFRWIDGDAEAVRIVDYH